MKKYLYLLVCVLLCFISACSTYNIDSEQTGIIDSGAYYRIYKGDNNQVCYDIYNPDGKIVLSEKTDRPLEIKMIDNEELQYISTTIQLRIFFHGNLHMCCLFQIS